MTKKPANHGKPITPQVVQQIKQLAKENTPTRVYHRPWEWMPGGPRF